MATSGSKSVTVTSWDTLKFSWWVNSQSKENNTSSVGWKLELIAGSSGRIDSSASKSWKVTVDGFTYSGTNTVGISNNTTRTLASGSTTVTHGADGTKTFSYTFSQEFGITFSGSSIGTKSGSGTGTLNTIARLSELTVSQGFLGTAVTLTVKRYSTSFTHGITYKCGTASGTVCAPTTTAGSISFTPPLSLASQNTTGSNVSITFTITTYKSGASLSYGTRSVTRTFFIPSTVKPTISSVAVVETVEGLADKFGALIQTKSKVKATITAKGSQGSTISAYSATYQGTTYTSSPFTSAFIKSAGTQTMTAKVKDSRGMWSDTVTKTFTALAYSAPKITAFKAYRVDETGATNDEGKYAAVRCVYTVAELSGKNTASAKLEYKRSTESEYTELTTLTDLSLDTTLKPSIEFSPDYQYDVKLTVTDYFGAKATYTTVLPSAAVILDIAADGEGISFGKTSDRPGVDFGWSAKGAVLGLWEATAAIPENGDLNDYTQPGVYGVTGNAVAATLLNRPTDKAGTLRVWSAIGIKRVSGAWSYILQEYHPYMANEPVYRRQLHSDGTGAFTASAWVPVTLLGQKVLWQGAWYMTEGHTIELPEPISKQSNGITLVFSQFVNGSAEDNNFILRSVPKKFVELKPGVGHCFELSTFKFAKVGTKYLYINDQTITGHADNIATGDAASGITYNNAAFVLRYVLGD